MPEPIKAGRRYMPGLDGLRAVAVLGVLAYHLGIDAIPGGFLGVSVFFTLSGYLITDLILGQIGRGDFRLSSFWMARFRRLLPALFVMLLIVAAWVTVIGPNQAGDFRAAVATSALYVNNWWLVLRDVSYFAQFDAPGPLNHLWSLAVEEQFYLVWPFLMLGGTLVIREIRRTWVRPRLALAILALAAVSATLMISLYQPGADPSRVYYGTDSRAAELLVGAALAAVWPSQRLRGAVSPRARLMVDTAGVVGLAVIFLFFTQMEEFSPFLYRGGFVVLSAAVSLVVAAVAHPASRLGVVLGWRPIRWIGERSYGIYLWHFPIIVLVAATGAQATDPVSMTLVVAATLLVSALSWKFIEDPIRHGAIGRFWSRVREGTLPVSQWAKPAPLMASIGALLVVVPAGAGLAGVGVVEDSRPNDSEIAITETVTAEPEPSPAESLVTTTVESDEVLTAELDVEPALGPCTSVVHVGDSTSLGMLDEVYIPDESQQLPAQYARVGVTTQHLEIAGGRGIIEGYKTVPPARESATKWRDADYHGCWVFALGTMDAATVAIGGRPGIDERIDIMMEIAAGDPVMWVNVRTIATEGNWRSEVVAPWNDALLDACNRHDNMRIYDWASDVQDDWYEPDGVHQNNPGNVERAQRIADALATAFPGTAATPDTPTAGSGCSFDLS